MAFDERTVSRLLRESKTLSGRAVQGVWVFGSAARGTAHAESDLDLAVLCEPPLGIERAALMDDLGLELGRDVDVIDLRTANPTLAWEIVTTGRILEELDEFAVEHFVRHARYNAEDHEQQNRMVVLASTGTLGGQSA
jgi:predicted nucleotidyltransferase